MVFAGCVVKEQTGALKIVVSGHRDLNWGIITLRYPELDRAIKMFISCDFASLTMFFLG
jgi:hypothetical protein